MSDLTWLNPTPHAIAVYASQPPSRGVTQHSLPSGRYSLLGPDFHRLDRTSLPGARRGRDASYLAPPAQIRTCDFPAYGSHLGCVTAKRSLGQGWRMIGFGRKSSANFVIRAHVIRAFWLRRRSVRRQRSVT